eukprot:GHVT01025537.1.p1 GENE.GHVT01025537.1~~GHVT01025537.1.p1  ORF type:complete len:678 (-),score=147.34 GHVT01025537.1:1172-3205(-)
MRRRRWPAKSKDVDLMITSDFGTTTRRLVYRGNKFLASNGYIFVAKLLDSTRQTVSLVVSTDGGDSFEAARLPVELQQKSYTVLDTSEGAIMLHVNHGDKQKPDSGNVYISDEKGLRYSLSLPNNVRTASGECEFDKVMSLEGVYLANFKDEAEGSKSRTEAVREAEALETGDAPALEAKHKGVSSRSKAADVVRTVISMDKGGVWSFLKAPKVDSQGKKIDCPPDRCWLHLHGISKFAEFAPFYSVDNAVGIIMGTGNVGSHLKSEADEVNTYLSRDGGFSWIEAHKGAYIYEFGDHGGLLVMADDTKKTNQVVFSWNEGQSWFDFELGQHPIQVDNVVIEPKSSGVEFLLYGKRDDVGVLYHLDFSTLAQPRCKGIWAADSVASDYETWTPTDGRSGGDRCILGRQSTYTRRKQTSECFNGREFERPKNVKLCVCTKEDYECEFGFSRAVGSLECRPEDPRLTAEGCTASSFFYTHAYRRVPGDVCEGGWVPQKVAVPCPQHAPFSKGAKMVLVVVILIAVLMFLVTYSAKNPRLMHIFRNYGFDSFSSVRYNTLGKMHDAGSDGEEESGNRRYGPEFGFIDAEQDDHEEDAPRLMAYTTASQRPTPGVGLGDSPREGAIASASSAASSAPPVDGSTAAEYRGISRRTAAAGSGVEAVPRLSPPPGSEVENVELL